MFGTNRTLKQDLQIDGSLLIKEIFPTIQGEGPYCGEPAIFVRLGGCNLKCYWCDTDFESNLKRLSPAEVIEEIKIANEHMDSALIVLTGGEPLRQNIVLLCEELLIQGYRVQIETAGTLWVPGLPYDHDQLTIVCSPKTGKVHEMMQHAHAWKYIIQAGHVDPHDGLPNISTQIQGKEKQIARPTNGATVFVQALDERDIFNSNANLEETARVAMKYLYRLSIQMHKIIGLP